MVKSFLKVCKQITKYNKIKKPVLVLKSGRSPEGAQGSDVTYGCSNGFG